MANPSRRAVNELYSFLSHKNLPITDSGTFLAYKSVRSDYTDHHTGEFSNALGSVLEMPRNAVCDNAGQGCSDGFHAGSLQYASSFGGDGSVLLIVEIDPADVVSIPSDCSCQKLRTCKYKVVSLYAGLLPEHHAKSAERAYEEEESFVPYRDDGHGWGSHQDDFVRDSKGRFAKTK